MQAMDAPARMTPEDRCERLEREGETQMNENGGNRPGVRVRRLRGFHHLADVLANVRLINGVDDK